jgi:hypothetical protein
VTNKYWPRSFKETAADPTPASLISRPLLPPNVVSLPKERPLHQILVENLNSSRALLTRLESGVTVPRQAYAGDSGQPLGYFASASDAAKAVYDSANKETVPVAESGSILGAGPH